MSDYSVVVRSLKGDGIFSGIFFGEYQISFIKTYTEEQFAAKRARYEKLKELNSPECVLKVSWNEEKDQPYDLGEKIILDVRVIKNGPTWMVSYHGLSVDDTFLTLTFNAGQAGRYITLTRSQIDGGEQIYSSGCHDSPIKSANEKTLEEIIKELRDEWIPDPIWFILTKFCALFPWSYS